MHVLIDGTREAEERDFAREIRATLTPNDLQNSLKNIAATGGDAGKAFARRHQLPFTPAEIRLGLHTGRPQNLLIIESALDVPQQDNGICGNSQSLAALLA